MNLGTTRLRSRPRNMWQDELRDGGRIVGGEGWQDKVQGGSNMTGTDLCVNKPHCAAAVRP